MAYQGSLDGLCGPYAIVNALAFCGLADVDDDMFQLACSRMGRSRWPGVLWDGTTFGDLQRMIKACVDDDLNELDIRVSYPFRRRVPKTNADYWTRFDQEFSDLEVRCAIVGLKQPESHWIVAHRSGRSISFVDSDPNKTVVRKSRATIHAGDRRKSPRHWLIEKSEFALFRVP